MGYLLCMLGCDWPVISHQLCVSDLRVKQLAGPRLTFFINRPLVSLMNCSVPERLTTPFL